MQAASFIGVYGLCIIAIAFAAAPVFGHLVTGVFQSSLLHCQSYGIGRGHRLAGAPVLDLPSNLGPLFALCSQQFRKLKNGIANRQTHLDRLVDLSRQMDCTLNW